MTRKILLVCGIVASLLYVTGDILAASLWEGYSYTSQAVSELMAIEAPTRPLLVVLFSIYDVLVIAFGLGVYAAAGKRRALRAAGILLIAYAIGGGVALFFFPMHVRGGETTTTDVMHIVVTGVVVLVILASVGLGASAGGAWFRLYSIVTILVLLVFGALAGVDGSRLAAHLPTPWFGVTERINIFSWLLWVVVFALMLLRAETRSARAARVPSAHPQPV